MFPVMKISVLLPVYSEVENLRGVVDRLAGCLKDELAQIILIVHPASSAQTFALIDDLQKQYPLLKAHCQTAPWGLGSAFRQALPLACGTHVLMMDSDGEMDPATVPAMMAKMRQTGADLVVASRWLPGGGVQGYDPVKYLCNRLFQCFARGLFHTPLHDVTLGFKLFERNKAVALGWNSRFHEIAVETTLRPVRMGWRVEEVPTRWTRREKGFSKNPFWRNWRYVSKALEIYMTA